MVVFPRGSAGRCYQFTVASRGIRTGGKRALGLALLTLLLSLAGLQVAAGSAVGKPPAAPAPSHAPGDDQSGLGPHEVRVGVFVMNIQTVTLAENRFDADFYLWMRWRGDEIDPTKGITVVNAHERWALNVEPVYDEPQIEPDGTRQWELRIQGNFNAPLSLSRYPFDRQTLRIILEDEELNSQKLVYRPDEDPIRISQDVTLPGYDIGRPRISFPEFTYDVGPATGRQNLTYPRIVVEIPLTAPTASGIIKVVVPMLIVLAAAAIALVIPSAYVDSGIALPITSLLALVAMHLGISSSLQDVNYLLMVDVLYIVGYAAATGFLGVSIASAWALGAKGEQAAFAMQRRLLALISVGYLIGTAVVLLVYLL